jgi:hypothetical protein
LAGGAGASAAGAAAPASVGAGIGDVLTLASESAPADATAAGGSGLGSVIGGVTPGGSLIPDSGGLTAAGAAATGGGAVDAGPIGGGLGSASTGGTLSGAVGGGTPAAGGSALASGGSTLGGATTGLAGTPATGPANVIGGTAATNALNAANPIQAALNGVGQTLAPAGSFLKSNASWLLPAGALGYDALKSEQGLGNIPGYNQLNTEAGQLASQGSQLQNYLQTGTLPPGVSQSLNQAATAATASIKSQYAARGMSGSSAEAADLANVQSTVAGQGAQIAIQLLNQGVSESNLSATLYGQIMNANITQDNQLGTALTAFASAAAKPTVTLNQTASTSS